MTLRDNEEISQFIKLWDIYKRLSEEDQIKMFNYGKELRYR